VINWYNVLKYIHVLSVVIWIGGLTGLAVVIWRIAKERNRAALIPLLKHGASYGQLVVGPAAGFVLLTGLTMVGIGHIGYATLWVFFGYAGILVHGVVGGAFVRKRAEELLALAANNAGADATLQAAARRLWVTQLTYLILLAIVIAGMVIKPTF